MRRSIALLTIAAAALFLGFVTSVPVAVAQGGARVIIPESSIEHPEDIGVRAHTNYAIVIPDHVEIGPNGAPIAENPASLACIYHLVTLTKGCPKTSKVFPSGGTKAIAIVDAYDNADAVTDINTFAAAYGYGTPNFEVVKVGNPSSCGPQGWCAEESLDIEYSFGMAPNAKIYLVEAASNYFSDLLAAEDKATALVQAAGGGEVSNSWGGSEFSGENSYDSHFKGLGVVYFASTGDRGAMVQYPSASPNVVAVGGTTIVRKSNGYFEEETGWVDAGGGPSQFESRPSYQNVIKSIVGTHRGVPDISSDANYPASPVAVYSQLGCSGWCFVGGTSVSSPTIAGIINAAGEFKTATKAELTQAYNEYNNPTKYKAFFTDITAGSNGYQCKTGWEYCTGIGSPKTLKGK